MRTMLVIAAVCAGLAPGVPLRAQDAGGQTVPGLSRPAESLRSRYVAERNQFGLLAFCRDHGLVAEAALERQRAVLAALSPDHDPTLGAAEEAAGRAGLIAFGGSVTPLAADVAGQGISLAYGCLQMAIRVGAGPR